MKVSAIAPQYSAETAIFLLKKTNSFHANKLFGIIFYASISSILYVTIGNKEAAFFIAISFFLLLTIFHLAGYEQAIKIELEKKNRSLNKNIEISYEIQDSELVFNGRHLIIYFPYENLSSFEINDDSIKMCFNEVGVCIISNIFFKKNSERNEFIYLLQNSIVSEIGESRFSNAQNCDGSPLKNIMRCINEIILGNGLIISAIIIFSLSHMIHTKTLFNRIAIHDFKCPDKTKYHIYKDLDSVIEECRNGENQIHGRYSQWKRKGVKHSDGVFNNDKKVGHWVFYQENGHLHSRGKFKNDMADGRWDYWNENGKYAYSEVYKDGKFLYCKSESCDN